MVASKLGEMASIGRLQMKLAKCQSGHGWPASACLGPGKAQDRATRNPPGSALNALIRSNCLLDFIMWDASRLTASQCPIYPLLSGGLHPHSMPLPDPTNEQKRGKEPSFLLFGALLGRLRAQGRTTKLTHALQFSILHKPQDQTQFFRNEGGMLQGKTDECGWRELILIFPKILGLILLLLKNLGFKKSSGGCPRSVCKMMVVLGFSEKDVRVS
jgi:hypothetical protein